VQRLTGSQIKSLRTGSIKSRQTSFCLIRGTLDILARIASNLAGMFAPPVKPQAKCKLGHTPPKTWGQGYPQCVNCGEEIRSREDLRGSSKFR